MATPVISLPTNFTIIDAANEINRLRGQGFSDIDITGAVNRQFGQQSQGDLDLLFQRANEASAGTLARGWTQPAPATVSPVTTAASTAPITSTVLDNSGLFENIQSNPFIQNTIAEAQPKRPTAVLFGDSMSEYVGYNPDGTPNTKYGNSVADVIGNNLGIQVQNLATGGETSMEALVNGSKFGAFANYIATNKPKYAIIRYGAADAIKNRDPQATLNAVQQMVDISKAYGVTPIIVGVSELYGAQNSKTGNIAGYIDAGAEQRANAINNGLAQIAANNGVSFTDVRSAVSAGKGDLLDGVHSNVDFGKKMADAISESIVSVIPEANIPKLPANVDALSASEKGRLYNDLISQGYTDSQIRTAARAESDQDWNALKQIAADVKNTTPAQVERQVALSATSTNLEPKTGTLSQSVNATQTASPNALSQKAASVLASSSVSNDPRFADSVVGTFVDNGVTYNVQGDGSFTKVSTTPDQVVTTTTFTPAGQEVGTYVDTRFQTTDLDRLLEAAAYTALSAATAAGLGPAGVGLFGTPGAAAAGAGTTNLIRTGSVEDALKAAALAGATAYGIQGLMGGGETAGAQQALELSIADDITNLSQQGLSQNQITNIISQGYGVDPFTAAEAVTSTLSSASSTTAGQTVNIAGTGLLNPAISPTAVSSLATMAGTAPGQSVTVQGQNLPKTQVTTQDLLAALTPAITNTLPAVSGGTQSVDVSGTRVGTTNENLINSIIPALTTAALPGAAEAVTQPTGTQQVEVTGTRNQSLLPFITSPVIPAITALPAGITNELPKATQTTQKTNEKSLFNPSDILKIIGLLGGAGAGAALSNAGTGTISTPPSDMMLGSTTPQFGPDYYAAVQRYYNAYMPETPRNVATPLQQWYENKFGA